MVFWFKWPWLAIIKISSVTLMCTGDSYSWNFFIHMVYMYCRHNISSCCYYHRNLVWRSWFKVLCLLRKFLEAWPVLHFHRQPLYLLQWFKVLCDYTVWIAKKIHKKYAKIMKLPSEPPRCFPLMNTWGTVRFP